MDANAHPQIRILLADSDVTERATVRRALEQAGYSVSTADDGAEAIVLFSPDLHDVIIAAIPMQLRDGLEVLRQVKQHSPVTQVILLADASSVGSASLGLREGAFTYFQKPIADMALLVHAVESAAELHALRRQMEGGASIHPLRPEASSSVSDGLHQFVRMFQARQSLPDLLQWVAGLGAQLFDAPHAVLLRARPDEELKIETSSGFENAEQAARDFIVEVGEPAARLVATERKTSVHPFHPNALAEASDVYVGAPLVGHGRLFGVLLVYPVRPETVQPARLADLESLCTVGALAIELDELGDENNQLRSIDSLTGTLKRSAFLDIADREFRRSWRFDQPLTAILLGIDGLDSLEQRFGAVSVDMVTREIGSACRRFLRSIDLVARYERDLFAVLLVMTGREEGKAVAERLHASLRSIQLPDGAEPGIISIPFGMSTYPRESCASIFDLLNAARAALDAARSGGVNQIFFA